MGVPRSAPVRIDLVRVLELLRTHITPSLCQTVFHTVRTTERQRCWSLEALVDCVNLIWPLCDALIWPHPLSGG